VRARERANARLCEFDILITLRHVFSQTPGPGAYAQADPNVYKGRAPLYTLRPRVAMPGDSTLKPGPGAHSPEKVIGQ